MDKQVDVIENLIQAVSLLNKTEEYFQSLDEELSKNDSLLANYEHYLFSENKVETIVTKEHFEQVSYKVGG